MTGLVERLLKCAEFFAGDYGYDQAKTCREAAAALSALPAAQVTDEMVEAALKAYRVDLSMRAALAIEGELVAWEYEVWVDDEFRPDPGYWQWSASKTRPNDCAEIQNIKPLYTASPSAALIAERCNPEDFAEPYPPREGEPAAWRDAIHRVRDMLGQAGGVGIAGVQNNITEREVGGWILDAVEDELAALYTASPSAALIAERDELTKQRDMYRRKQYHLAANRAICYVSKDGETVSDVYDLPVERMPNGYDYAAELEAAEAENAALKEQLAALQQRFDLELDGYAKDSDIAALKAALEPFKAFATNNLDADDGNSWGGSRCEGDRICDWFGPSEFNRARAALQKDTDSTHPDTGS